MVAAGVPLKMRIALKDDEDEYWLAQNKQQTKKTLHACVGAIPADIHSWSGVPGAATPFGGSKHDWRSRDYFKNSASTVPHLHHMQGGEAGAGAERRLPV